MGGIELITTTDPKVIDQAGRVRSASVRDLEMCITQAIHLLKSAACPVQWSRGRIAVFRMYAPVQMSVMRGPYVVTRLF